MFDTTNATNATNAANAANAANAVRSIPVLTSSRYQRPSATRHTVRRIVQQYIDDVEERAETQLGYPLIPANIDSGVDLDIIDAASGTLLNNVGDPSKRAIFSLNSHPFELGVLQYFSKLWGLSYEDAWGFVASSSSEAILQAVYTARELHGHGRVYVSRDAHYSSKKSARILGLELVEINTDELGRLEYDDFRKKLDPSRPAFVIATVGTTMTGSIDDIDELARILDDVLDDGVASYMHVDAAFTGAFLPFVEGYAKFVSFNDRVDSISTSGHKFLGTTTPCGIYVCREHNIAAFEDTVEYIHARDVTISCSRNGQVAIELWAILSQLGQHGLEARATDAISTAVAAVDAFVAAHLRCHLLHGSTTLVIDRPSDDVVTKYQLAVSGSTAHIVCMPTTSIETIEMLIRDTLDDLKLSKI